MKRRKISNVAASVRQRLLNKAQASGRQFDFDGGALTAAVRETFARRDLEVAPHPVALTEEFAADTAKANQWRGFLRKSRLEGAPGELAEVVEAIADRCGVGR